MTAVTTEPRSTHTPAKPPAHVQTLAQISLSQLRESKLNPRQHFDAVKLAELAANIATNGILAPLIVRPLAGGTTYEIGAGHRRFRAALQAKLTAVPCIVREMADDIFLELLTIENLKRDDLHELEEAQGYTTLMKTLGYDVPRIAHSISKSVEYVYARLKLLQLIGPLQTLFLAREITASHAVLLARLSPEDQKRAADPKRGGLYGHEHLEYTELEFNDRRGVVSVRELEDWIAGNIRLDPKGAELPGLFPEAATVVAKATEQKEQIAQITSDWGVEQQKGQPRIYSSEEWKRADGRPDKLHHQGEKSKTCDRAITGVVVLGRGRGQAFRVCVDKGSCQVHWPKAKASTSSSGTRTSKKERARQAKERTERQRQDERRKLDGQRWTKAVPLITAALLEKIKKAPAGGKSPLADHIVEFVDDNFYASQRKGLPSRGTSAEDFVRYLGARLLLGVIEDHSDVDVTIQALKPFGVDVKKIMDQAAPLPKPEKKGKKGK